MGRNAAYVALKSFLLCIYELLLLLLSLLLLLFIFCTHTSFFLFHSVPN